MASIVQHEVEGPDGTIHIIEAPDDADPIEIEKFAAQSIPQDKMDLSATKSAGANFVNMVPGGADAFGAIAAITHGGGVDAPFGDKQRAAKAMIEQAATQGTEQHPYASAAGGIAGAIAPALLVPAKAYQGASVLHRAGKGAGVAAGMGALYGAGKGNTIDDRIANAVTTGVMAAPFGAGGSLAVDALSAGGRVAAPHVKTLAERAKRIFRKAPEQIAGGSPGAGTGVANLAAQNVDQASIPLTQGQLTQSPKQQALEYGAQAGVYGDDARNLALEARDIQSEAAKQALGNPSEIAALEGAENIQKNLKSAYTSAKAKTSAAYKKVGEATQEDPLKIAGSYVRETVFPSMRDWLRKGDNGIGFDLNAEGFGEAKRLYQQAEAAGKAERLSGMNFSRLEFWRSKVTNRLAKTVDPTERKFLGGMLDRYDMAMKNLPREAIKNGDDAIIDMMEAARTARKEQGVLFERSKLVKDIVQNDDLTSEQLANTLTSLGPKTGNYVRDILRTAKNDPAKQEALRQELKKSILGSALTKSLSAEARAGSSVEGGVQKMVSFDKLATNLDKLSKNKTLLKQIMPDEAERAAFTKNLRAIQLIKSQKPGTKNYSNTAYTLLNYMRSFSPAVEKASLPFVGSAGGGLERWGQGAAALELEQSLAPVLKSFSDDMNGPLINLSKKYGIQSTTGASVAQAARNAPITETEE